MRNFKGDKYFVDEVKTQLREKPHRDSQTQDFHYSKDKASYKVVALTYQRCSGRTLNSVIVPIHERFPTKSSTSRDLQWIHLP